MQKENNGFGRIGGIQVVMGDLIEMTKEGHFDVIGHGCNCRNAMGAGIARQIRSEFPDAFYADKEYYNSHNNKYGMMGNYSRYLHHALNSKWVAILNMYTQYEPGSPSPSSSIPLDYEALTMCLRKANQEYPGMSIGLPWIGCGLAGGSKSYVKQIIVKELYNMNVTIVEYEPNTRHMVETRLGETATAGEGPSRGGERPTGEGYVARDRGGREFPEPLGGFDEED